MNTYSFFQPKNSGTTPKYAMNARAAPSKQVIGRTNKYAKPTTTINLDAASKNSRSNSRGGVFDRLSNKGSARQNSNQRKAEL